VTPLQKVAMGLVIVFLTARFGGYDALPDPVGWGLAIAGLVTLRTRVPHGGTLLWLAAIAGVISVPLVVPQVNDAMSPAGQWGVGVPQTVFCVMLCISLATLAERAGEPEAVRFGLLRTGYLVVLALPVLVYGGNVVTLETPMAVLSVLCNVALVYYTFKVSRRPYVYDSPAAVTGDPGVDPGVDPDRDPDGDPEKDPSEDPG
jgi:hypothetical protein